jgi:ribosome maturation factor RimP
MVNLAARARDLIGEVVEGEGFELVHVEYLPQGSSPILRVYVDRPGGITISDCAELSRRIGVLLDVEDFIPTHYLLEVSSPGIERPLFTERDYRRHQGQEIRLTTVEKVENRRNFTGVIQDLRDQVLWLTCGDQTYLIPLASIQRAHLVYHFD